MENQLIEKLIDQCPKTQKLFYEIHSEKMFLVLLRFIHNEIDANTVLNHAFFKAFQNIEKYTKIENLGITAWLRKIVVNEALMFLNSRKQIIYSEDLDLKDTGSSDLADNLLTAEDYHQIICELPIGYRTVFNLYAIEGYSHKEIAEQLGISESTSRSQLTHARAMLKTKLKKI